MEFVTIILLFYVLFFGATGMWDLSFPTRNRTCTPCIGRQSLNQHTTREVPVFTNFSSRSLCFHTNSLMHPMWGQMGMGKQRRPEGKRSKKQPTWVGWKLLMSNVIFILLPYLKVDSSTWVSSGARWTLISFLARDGYTRKAWCPLRSCHANGPWRPSISHWPFPAREAGQAWCSPVSFGSCEEKWQVSVMPLYLML